MATWGLAMFGDRTRYVEAEGRTYQSTTNNYGDRVSQSAIDL
jgi:hypothetical protein